MSKTNENTTTVMGLVSRAVSLAIALVITSIVATGFASATNHIPVDLRPSSFSSIHN